LYSKANFVGAKTNKRHIDLIVFKKNKLSGSVCSFLKQHEIIVTIMKWISNLIQYHKIGSKTKVCIQKQISLVQKPTNGILI